MTHLKNLLGTNGNLSLLLVDGWCLQGDPIITRRKLPQKLSKNLIQN